MQPDKNSRLDTRELKAQLLKRVGQENFKMYFHCLNRFINQKLSKSEFDKSCYRILGRENLPLHNQIIKAILKNTCSAETPPLQAHKVAPTTKSCTGPKRSSLVLEDGHGQSSVAPIWSNGVVPMSPRKGRSAIRDRKLRDRPSPFGPNGMSVEDGDLGPLCKLQGLAEQPENDEELVMEKPEDISGVFRGNDQSNAVGIEYLEDRERGSRLKFSRSHLIAPLGIPYCSANTGGSRKVLPVTDAGDYVSCFDLGGLSSSETLRRRMEQIAASQGLGVTLECVNTLNNMVDVYMKRLISSGLHLVSSRSTSDMSAYPIQKQQIHGKPINGLWPSNHMHMQNSQSVSLLDFKVAIELNPQQLGENWPLLFEKISMQGFDE